MKGLTASDLIFAVLRFIFEAIQFVSRIFFRFRYEKPGKSMPPIDDSLLLDSATTLARKIRTRQVTSARVVETFINRIKRVNPTFNCIADLRFDAALQDARRVDEGIAQGTKTEQQMEEETPFLGVPFTFKSCLSCKGMRHTGGLTCRRHYVASEDAEAVTLLREAGAIPIASTNVPEVCLWWETYNSVHGWTSNPYDSNRTAGGSSGGEGCVQAFGGSPMGIGSDIGGSIRIPSHCNGIFGHKPTNGCSTVKGHFPFPRYSAIRSTLVIGPMSRFASDLLPVLKVISRDWSKELKLDEKPDVKRLRYFYMEDDGGSAILSKVEPEMADALRRVVEYLKNTLGVTVQRVNLTRMREGFMIWSARMKAKEGPVLGKALADFRGSKNLIWEILMFLLGKRQHTLPVLVAALLEQSAMTYGDSVHSYYMKEGDDLKKEFEQLLGTDGVFIFPSLPSTAPYHSEANIRPFDFTYAAIFNCFGFPVTQCPLGLDSKGLPLGVQVVSLEKHDRFCLAVAEELERGFGGWVPPAIRIPRPSEAVQ